MSAEPVQKSPNVVSIVPEPAYILTPKQKKAAEMIAHSKTREEILATLKITLRTYYLWQKLSLFQDEVKRVGKALFAETMAQLQEDKDSLGPLAVMVLKNQLLSGNAKVAIEVAKAMNILVPPVKETDETITVEFGITHTPED